MADEVAQLRAINDGLVLTLETLRKEREDLVAHYDAVLAKLVADRDADLKRAGDTIERARGIAKRILEEPGRWSSEECELFGELLEVLVGSGNA